MSEEGVRYELLEVTADVAVRALGNTPSELFENAAWGMADLICDTATVREEGEWLVSVEANDLGALMVDALTELLVIHETESVVFASFQAELAPGRPPHRLTLVARGETYDPGRHSLLHDIKAVTYHTLEVDPGAGHARVLFDI